MITLKRLSAGLRAPMTITTAAQAKKEKPKRSVPALGELWNHTKLGGNPVTSAKPVKLEKQSCSGSLLWHIWLHKGKQVLPLGMERLLHLHRYLTESLNWHTAECCTKERESRIANKSPDKALSYFFLDKIHMAMRMPQESTTYSQIPATSMKGGGRKRQLDRERRGNGRQPVLGGSRPLPTPPPPHAHVAPGDTLCWAGNTPSREQRSSETEFLLFLKLSAVFTALCQLKSFNQNTGFACLRERTRGSSLQVRALSPRPSLLSSS